MLHDVSGYSGLYGPHLLHSNVVCDAHCSLHLHPRHAVETELVHGHSHDDSIRRLLSIRHSHWPGRNAVYLGLALITLCTPRRHPNINHQSVSAVFEDFWGFLLPFLCGFSLTIGASSILRNHRT